MAQKKLALGSALGFIEIIVTVIMGAIRKHGEDSILSLPEDKVRELTRKFADSLIQATKLVQETITVTDTPTPAQLIERIKAKDRYLGDWAKDIMYKPEFAASIKPGVYKLMAIPGSDFASDSVRTTAHVFAEAERRGYRKPPVFLAAVARADFSSSEQGAPRVAFMNEPIVDSYRNPNVLVLHDDDFLRASRARPEFQWDRDYLFVFLAPQES